MNKRFVVILAVLIIGFAGLLVFTKKEANAPENGGNADATPTNHTVGANTAGVTLTEYGDFECSACAQYYPLVKQIKEKYGDKIAFQFRHFPLTEIHQNALISSRAAEAAGLQGKFFEMHDKLYENQQAWATSTNSAQIFEDYAAQLGLNVDKFREDMRSSAVNDSVQADRAEAKKKSYSSTPTFEINGQKIDNPRSPEDFEKLIDEAIAQNATP